MPDRLDLAGLHIIIQKLFGWDDYHLWEFVVGGEQFGPEGDLSVASAIEVRLSDVLGERTKKFS